MNRRPDDALLREYVENRSDEAFRELALRHGPLVYGACLRRLKRSDLAEDAAQVVFLVLSKKARRLIVRTSLVPWLLTTSRIVCWNIARTERRRLRHEKPLNEEIEAPEMASDAAFFDAIDVLRGSEREAIVLRFVQGLSLREIGEAQGITEDAARMRVQRALAKVRKKLVPSLSSALTSRLSLSGLISGRVQSYAYTTQKIMRTLLALSTGTATLLVTVGVASGKVNSMPTELPPTYISSAPITQGRQGGAASDTTASAPIPANADTGSLNRPFTLHYRLTRQLRLTKAMKDYKLAERKKELDKQVASDQMTQAKADADLAKMVSNLNHADIISDITISYDGHALLFEELGQADSSENCAVIVRDGKTFSLFPKRHTLAWRDEGTVSIFSGDMPLIGPSLPFHPISQGGDVLTMMAAPPPNSEGMTNRLMYSPGKLVYGQNGALERVELGSSKPPENVFNLSQPLSFQGHLVAQTITNTANNFFPGPDQGVPRSHDIYVLTSSSENSEPAERFEPGTYMDEGDNLQLNLPKGVTKLIEYHRSKGSMDDQIKAALSGGR